MELVDTHCHLDAEPLGADVGAVLGRARLAGVTRVIVPAYDTDSQLAVAALAAHDGVHLAFGLHPWHADRPLDAGALEERLRSPRTVAVGEIGLDFTVPAFDKKRQLALCERQLELACRLGLPVILHCRRAFEELIAMVKSRAPAVRGVVHAYTRGPDLARRLVEECGLHLGLGGTITRRDSQRARAGAKWVPVERMLLETDAPSIGLEGVPPEACEPRHVASIAACLAEIRGTTVEEVARRTTENALRLFGLS